MKSTALLLFMLLISLFVKAQQNYDVNLIPKELLSHASCVVRNNETIVEVKDLSNVLCHYKAAITILNKNADDEARIVVYHDKMHQIKYIKGAVYNEFGKLISKFSEHDFDDRNVADGFSLFNDDMVKHFSPAVTTYPYTVEYDYEIGTKETLLLNDWDPYPGKSIGVSIEHSAYKLLCKPDFAIRYKAINYNGKIDSTIVQDVKTYSCAIENVKAIRSEPFSADNKDLLPSVKIAPVKFSYAGISGSFTNWNEYGKWIYDKLLKDRKQLPPETVQHIKDITRDIPDPKQKARIIYEYMQQKTRYVSVQVGIGGYQPFLASEVDQSSYGDCKALVNYTQTLLNVAGIDSYYVLVMPGSIKVSAIPDFASMNQFRHVILCLPFKNDTTWLECTSQQTPFGYLGVFTDDRNVIACTPEGGKLMHTTVYKTADNKQVRVATFNLAANGELSGDMTTRFEGSQYEDREYLVKEPLKEQIKMLQEVYPIENLAIQNFSLRQDKSLKPATIETIKLKASDYAAQNGGRFFFMPNTASRYIEPIKNVMNRLNPVYINRGYLDEDEVTYTLPDDYKITTQKLSVSIDKPFGRYTASTQITGNKLVYKRTLQINDGTYSKDIYADLVEFYESVHEADRYTMTMEKK